MSKTKKSFLGYRLLRRRLMRSNLLAARFFRSTEAGTLNYRRLMLIFSDMFLVSASIVLAFLFRFDFNIPYPYTEQLKDTLLFVIVVRIGMFYLFRMYKGIWRYAGLQDLLSIVKAVTLGSVVLLTMAYGIKGFPYPRSILIVDWMICTMLIGGERFFIRVLRSLSRNGFKPGEGKGPKKILIIGAGDAGEMVLREIRNKPNAGYVTLGFIDDSNSKQGLYIHGVRVIGKRYDIPRIVNENDIDEVIIAIPSASGSTIKGIISICEITDAKIKIVPGLSELIEGRVSIKQIRDVALEDLLRREPAKIDLEEIRAFLSGKKVLITGAAGSIGSELCRVIAGFSPSEIIMLDTNENSIFYLEDEFNRNFRYIPHKIVVLNLRDKHRLEALIETERPNIIFHAAAYKHVPLMELNPEEAILNNIVVTRDIVDIAKECNVENFVFVSTDKAVNPTNIMGATKRFGEMIAQSRRDGKGTKFIIVRFGNVLGSNGSVVPLFRQQIEKGGPVTVTHPEVSRFFMTIPEAVQLIVQASALGKGGEIFVLDMGEPRKILDLAKDLITLSGFRPDEDIRIDFIGLRPGEKLYEEVLTREEGINATKHKQIYIARSNHIDRNKIDKYTEALYLLAKKGDRAEIIQKFKEIIPGFSNSRG